MPNGRSENAHEHVFDFETIIFKKAVNRFEFMEIGEKIMKLL